MKKSVFNIHERIASGLLLLTVHVDTFSIQYMHKANSTAIIQILSKSLSKKYTNISEILFFNSVNSL